MINALQRASALLLVLLCSACASMGTGEALDPPTVSLQSIRPVSGSGATPDFEITLRVVNPNNHSLNIAGVAYDVEVEGHELVSGVSNDIPRIDAYSEENVTLSASVNVFPLLRLLADVTSNEARTLEYQLKAKIDFEGLVPTQRISETGEIDLSGSR